MIIRVNIQVGPGYIFWDSQKTIFRSSPFLPKIRWTQKSGPPFSVCSTHMRPRNPLQCLLFDLRWLHVFFSIEHFQSHHFLLNKFSRSVWGIKICMIFAWWLDVVDIMLGSLCIDTDALHKSIPYLSTWKPRRLDFTAALSYLSPLFCSTKSWKETWFVQRQGGKKEIRKVSVQGIASPILGRPSFYLFASYYPLIFICSSFHILPNSSMSTLSV